MKARPSLCFLNDTATTEIYTLSLHDALPIFRHARPRSGRSSVRVRRPVHRAGRAHVAPPLGAHAREAGRRSEEHTSELQSRQYLVCRLLLEKKQEKQSIFVSICYSSCY